MRAIYTVTDQNGNTYQTFGRTSQAIGDIKAKASREFRLPIVAVTVETRFGKVIGRPKGKR